MREQWSDVAREAGELARSPRRHTYQSDKRAYELLQAAVDEINRLIPFEPVEEREETEEEREVALYALKWMNTCRRYRLEPSASTKELEYYVRQGKTEGFST